MRPSGFNFYSFVALFVGFISAVEVFFGKDAHAKLKLHRWGKMLAFLVFLMIILVSIQWRSSDTGKEQSVAIPRPVPTQVDFQSPIAGPTPARSNTPTPPPNIEVPTPFQILVAPHPPQTSETLRSTQFQSGEYACVAGGYGNISVDGPFPFEGGRTQWVYYFHGQGQGGVWITGSANGHPDLSSFASDTVLPEGWTFGKTASGQLIGVRQLGDSLIINVMKQTTGELNRTVISPNYDESIYKKISSTEQK